MASYNPISHMRYVDIHGTHTDIGSRTIVCYNTISNNNKITIMAGRAVFNVAGYIIEERRRWPVITAFPRGQRSK